MISFKFKDNYTDWHYVREEVFEKEQGFKEEFDDIDNWCTHVTMYEDDVLIGCGRYFKDDECYVIGRIALLMPYRKKGYSKVLISEIEKQIIAVGGKKIKLHSQCVATGVYAKCGYTPYGEIEYEEHVEHIWMGKDIV